MLNLLPYELWLHITTYLDYDSIVNFRKASLSYRKWTNRLQKYADLVTSNIKITPTMHNLIMSAKDYLTIEILILRMLFDNQIETVIADIDPQYRLFWSTVTTHISAAGIDIGKLFGSTFHFDNHRIIFESSNCQYITNINQFLAQRATVTKKYTRFRITHLPSAIDLRLIYDTNLLAKVSIANKIEKNSKPNCEIFLSQDVYPAQIKYDGKTYFMKGFKWNNYAKYTNLFTVYASNDNSYDMPNLSKYGNIYLYPGTVDFRNLHMFIKKLFISLLDYQASKKVLLHVLPQDKNIIELKNCIFLQTIIELILLIKQRKAFARKDNYSQNFIDLICETQVINRLTKSKGTFDMCLQCRLNLLFGNVNRYYKIDSFVVTKNEYPTFA